MTNEIRVLVVDPEAIRAENLWLYFRLRGYTAHLVANTDEALRRLAERPYDLVISEIHLPGMNGFALMRRIHMRHPDLPVFLMTAFEDPQLRQEAVMWDADGVLHGPLDDDELTLAVDAALGRKAEQEIRAALVEAA